MLAASTDDKTEKGLYIIFSKCDLLDTSQSMQKHCITMARTCTILTWSNVDKLHIPASCKETVSLRSIFYGFLFYVPSHKIYNSVPYIGKYE